MVSKTIYIKAALFLLLLLLAGLSLVAFFLVGIGVFMTRNYLLLFGGLFFLVTFMILMSGVRKLEPAWEEVRAHFGFKPKPKTTREAFKENLPFFGIFILTFVVYGLMELYFNQFPAVVSKELARTMLNSVLTIDGILLGFFGVILAQFLGAIQNKGNLIYEQMINHNTDNEVIAHLSEESNRLNRDRIFVVIGMFYAAMPILASFLLCLAKLPLTEGNETIAVRTVMFDPLIALIAGIALVLIVSLETNLLPKRGKWPTETTSAAPKPDNEPKGAR
jgi:hypothetical protein